MEMVAFVNAMSSGNDGAGRREEPAEVVHFPAHDRMRLAERMHVCYIQSGDHK
jgi:hypothetical protein